MLACSVMLLFLSGAVTADADGDRTEAWDRGVSFYTDNDLFALVSRDQQYTGGTAIEFAGRRARDWPLSLDPLTGLADRWSGLARLAARHRARRRHSMTLGLAAFTPADISESGPIDDDHPYGSVVLLANNRQYVRTDRPVSYSSTFAVGLLGTSVAREFQNFFHDLGDSERAQGWSNQIANGGEPTFKYAISRQVMLHQGERGAGTSMDLRSEQFASLGFNTQVGINATLRWGRLRNPWWQWQALQGDYLDFGTSTAHLTSSGTSAREWFFWIGAAVRARLYNALIQGQFRDSEVTFSRSDLRILQGELAAGAAVDLPANRYRLQFELRWRTREIPNAEGQEPLWGRLTIARRF